MKKEEEDNKIGENEGQRQKNTLLVKDLVVVFELCKFMCNNHLPTSQLNHAIFYRRHSYFLLLMFSCLPISHTTHLFRLLWEGVESWDCFWFCTERSLLMLPGNIYSAETIPWVGCLQVKCPSHYNISPKCFFQNFIQNVLFNIFTDLNLCGSGGGWKAQELWRSATLTVGVTV